MSLSWGQLGMGRYFSHLVFGDFLTFYGEIILVQKFFETLFPCL